jgi:hypothetical protein
MIFNHERTQGTQRFCPFAVNPLAPAVLVLVY